MISKHENSLELNDERASEAWALKLAACLSAPAIITFSGEIGSGKTTIIRAVLKHLGIKNAIKSPSFSLVETYEGTHPFVLHHFDLYRIHQEDELEYIGFRDYFKENSICFIEWPERGGKLLPPADLKLSLSLSGLGRHLQIDAPSVLGKKILSCLVSDL